MSSFGDLSISSLGNDVDGEAYQEIFRRRGGRVEVNGPVHECLTASDGKDDSVHVVDGDGLDHHRFCSVAPVCFDVGFSLFAGRPSVHSLRVLRCQAYQRVRGHVTMHWY